MLNTKYNNPSKCLQLTMMGDKFTKPYNVFRVHIQKISLLELTKCRMSHSCCPVQIKAYTPLDKEKKKASVKRHSLFIKIKEVNLYPGADFITLLSVTI